MKLIMLDVDGVLNCHWTRELIGKVYFVEDKFIERLKKIVDATGAELVLTSTWRLMKDDPEGGYLYDALISKLKEFGLELLGETPNNGIYYRGAEIMEWFYTWELDGGDPIESFIILDDDKDMKPYGRRLVQTSWLNGLQDTHVEKAIEMLNEECHPWYDDTPYYRTEWIKSEHRQDFNND